MSGGGGRPCPGNKKKEEEGQKKRGAGAPRASAASSNETQDSGPPPGVRVFRENAHRYPSKSWYQDIDTTVGDDPGQLDFWGKVVHAYVGMGWNPTNVKVMLEFFRRGEIPGEQSRNEPAGYEGIRDWFDEQGIVVHQVDAHDDG